MEGINMLTNNENAKLIQSIYSLTPLQEGMLYHSLADKASSSYVVQQVYDVEGKMREELLRDALELLSMKHDVLRTAILYEKMTKPRQVVLKKRDIEYEMIDLAQTDEFNQKKEIERILSQDVKRGFYLQKDTLIRVKYIWTGEAKGKLIFTFHHIILDGWCLSLIHGDFRRCLNQLNEGTSMQELVQTVRREKGRGAQFSEYIQWLEEKDKEEGLAYWRELLTDYEEPAWIRPVGRPEPTDKQTVQTGICISKETGSQLMQAALNCQVTLNTIFETAWGIILQEYNRSKDVIFGKVVSGRNAEIEGIENTAGLFINTIPVRIQRSEGMRLSELLKNVYQQGIESSGYDYCSLADVLGLTQQGAELVKTLFAFENYYIQKEAYANAEKPGSFQFHMDTAREQTSYDISLTAYQEEEEIYLNLLYNPQKYSTTEIAALLARIRAVLLAAAKDIHIPIENIDLLTEEERVRITEGFNDTDTAYPRDISITELFEKQAETAPEHIALVHREEELTYAQLNAKINGLAHNLRELGVGPNDFVAVLAHRSTEMIAGILGIIKAGGAYVPIDPEYPQKRINYMLQDCRPKAILIYGEGLEDKLKAGLSDPDLIRIPVIDLASRGAWGTNYDNPKSVSKPDDLAYVIYTSGTTGKPKGVMIRHQGVVNLSYYLRKNFDITPRDNVLQFANYTFDASVWEMAMSIFAGAAMIVLPKGMNGNLTEFEQYCRDKKITVSTLPPQFYMQLSDFKPRVLITAGSEANTHIVRKAIQTGRYINAYGPTENTVCATQWEYRPEEGGASRVPIGKPIDNTKVYIMNANRLCGIGIPGELCITGDGLAQGYLNNEILTKKKFINNPMGQGKMYLTGDLARWLPDGNIEFLGRIDEQVKIRGFRIELEDVEHAIRNIGHITDCAVVVKEDSAKEQAMHAYIVSDEPVSLSEIREVLAKELPDYMIPDYMLQIERLPVNRSGKLDKRALPEIVVQTEKEYIAPRNETESVICKIFSEILGLEKIGVRDNFFRLGGHSLRATRLVNRIEAKTGNRILLKEVFANPTVEKLTVLIEGGKGKEYNHLPKAEEKEFYPMSSTQKRIFLIEQMKFSGVTYNLPQGVQLKGEVSPERVKSALQQIINRHEILRTEFLMHQGMPVQRIRENVPVEFTYREDLSISVRKKAERITEFVRAFRLDRAPLMRSELVKCNNGYLLMFDIHHIICDGMSIGTLMKEFKAIYAGEQPEPLAHQYKDYCEWMRNRDLSDQKEYWMKEFGGGIPVLDMPLDFKRPKEQSFNGNLVACTTGRRLWERIRVLVKKSEATEYMVFLSAAMILLAKYSNQEDIVIGSPVSGRTHPDTEGMLGMFVNTLAFRGRPEGGKKYYDFLEEVKGSCLKGYENQEYPFEELVEALEPVRDMARNPLFDVMLAVQNNERVKLELTGTEVGEINQEYKEAKFDLTFNIFEEDGDFQICLEYCTDLYRQESAERILARYLNILGQIVWDRDILIENIEMITEEDQELILEEFNNTGTQFPGEKTISELFEEQAEKTPENTALIYGEKTVTYEQLNQMANSLAHQLRDYGVGPDAFVVVLAGKSIEMVAGIHAVIKAGGAYVPVDPLYPKERIQYMLEDCKPRALLLYGREAWEKTADCGQLAKGIPVIDLADSKVWEGASENPVKINHPGDLAYVIYTSGTTGKPKGIMVEHKNIIKLVKNADYTKLDENTVILQAGALTFDASTFELWGSALNGGSLHLVNNDILLNAAGLKEYISSRKVTTMFLTTALFNQLILEDASAFDSLKHLMIGGEKASEKHVEILRSRLSGLIFDNFYGPTETTTFATHYNIWRKTDNIPIGKPISNTRIYIMRGDKLCPIGIPGELCVAGDGLARGYLNDTRLTEEKFIKNTFGEGRLYRSGDLARWLPDGNLEYLGRIDEQVKIRGFRIEPGEIENVLRRLEGIKDAVVIVREDASGDKALYAYLTADTKVDTVSLRRKLAGELPEYMIPAFMLQIEAIPVTENGKLNKRALPEIERKTGEEYAAPGNAMEEILCDIFREILNVDEVGIRDSFFALGGDSIKAIRIVSRLRTHGYDLSVKDIMRGYTVETIAAQVKKAAEVKYEQNEVSGAVTPTPILRKFEEWKLKKPEHFNQAMMLKVDTEDEAVVRRALDALVKHHDMLRAVYRNGQLLIRESRAGRLYDFAVSDYREENSEEGKIEEEKIEEERIEEECNRRQESMDLENGPLMKAVLFLTGEGGRMFFCLHHLIVDGVSWRILFEDFENAVRQAENQNEITLPMKTASYREWSEALEEYRRSKKLAKEKAYWEKVISQIPEGRIEREEGRGKEGRGKEERGKEERGKEEKGREEKGREEKGREEKGREEGRGEEGRRERAGGEGNRRERNGRAGGEGDGREGNGRAEGEGAGGEGIGREGEGYGYVEAALSREATEQLLYQAGQAYHTEINDLLVCALGMGIKDLTGQKKVAVSLEGHGREEIHKKIETDRTVGWFTSIYPVVLEMKEDLGESIIEVKETLRGVPNHGIGYGLLEDELHREETELCFNYLGEISAEGRSSIYSCGRSSAEENRMPGSINVNAVVENGEIHLGILYDRKRYSSAEMNQLAGSFQQNILSVLKHCLEQEQRIRTRSDYSTCSLDTHELKQLEENQMVKEQGLEDIYSLTPLQEGMLYHCLYDKQSWSYVIQYVYEIEGDVSDPDIVNALELLAIRHDVLRSAVFYENLVKPRQVVLKNRSLEYEKTVLTQRTKQEQEEEFIRIKTADIDRGFDLTRDSLMRVKNIITGETTRKLIFTFHHIILDGWCISYVFGDFMRYLGCLRKGATLQEMKELVRKEKRRSPEYGTYMKWLEEKDQEEGLSYWRELVSDYEEIAELRPVDIPEPEQEQMAQAGISISRKLGRQLIKIAAEQQVTINNIVEAVWAVVLQKCTGKTDVAFGKVVSGRNVNLSGIEQMVGMFINTIPVRARCDETTTMEELIREMNRQSVAGSDYEYCSLAHIQSQSRMGTNLIKTLFVFENYRTEKENGNGEIIDGLRFSAVSAREQIPYAIGVRAHMQGEELAIEILYNPNEFTGREINRVLLRMERVFTEIVKDLKVKISEIEAVTEEERRLILEKFNATNREYPKEKTIGELFEEQVYQFSECTALEYGDEKLTYRQLNAKVNTVAHKLRDIGIKPNDLVAVLAERSTRMIAGILGILKAGGAYVPIDPDYPVQRINYILENCHPRAILTYGEEACDKWKQCGASLNSTGLTLIRLEDYYAAKEEKENPIGINQPGDIAYVIYTSGTTGKPKGVKVRHQGVVNLKYYMANTYEITSKDCVLQYANYTFDASVWELTMSILCGAAMVLLPKQLMADPAGFEEYCKSRKVTVATLPPQFYIQLEAFSPRLLITAGSEANPQIVGKAANGGRYINAYGPTENTVCATHWEYNRGENIPSGIPIGKPIDNTRVYILSGDRLCGIGMPGELCIAGDGLAEGYLNNEALTDEKFVDALFDRGKMYRTGDLARWLPDGNIEFLGRIDDQIKIRGFRIEPGEIENTLRGLEQVKDAVVIAKEDQSKEKALFAYIVSDQEVDQKQLRKQLARILPVYMVPAHVMQIDRIPVNKNGKPDYRALPDIVRKERTQYQEPGNHLERVICSAFSEILGIEKIGINDSFLELGGDSIKAIRAAMKLRKTGYDISVKEIMQGQTAQSIAESKSFHSKSEKAEITLMSMKKAVDYDITKDTEEYRAICGYDQKNNYSVKENYKPGLLQKNFYLYQPSNICCFKIRLRADISQEELQNRMKEIIEKQPAFRMCYNTAKNLISELSYDNGWFIPCFCNSRRQEGFYDALWREVKENTALFSSDRLLAKLFIAKTGEDEQWLYFAIHHCIWDGMSTEILMTQLQGIFRHNNTPPSILPVRNNMKSDIPKDFHIMYAKALQKYNQLFERYEFDRQIIYREKYDSDCKAMMLEKPIPYILQKFMELSFDRLDLQIDYLPLMLMYHGRKEEDFMTMGMYLDLIPAIYDFKNRKITGGMDFINADYSRGRLLEHYQAGNENLENVPVINMRLIYEGMERAFMIPGQELIQQPENEYDRSYMEISADFVDENVQIILPKFKMAAAAYFIEA